jgi:hypothetical protein
MTWPWVEEAIACFLGECGVGLVDAMDGEVEKGSGGEDVAVGI